MAQKGILIVITICCLVGATWADAAVVQNQNNESGVGSHIETPVASSGGNVSKALPELTATKVDASVLRNLTATLAPKCVCDGALLPRLGENGKMLEICPECKCQHVARNTTLIKVVVIIVIWIISILVIYMLFLICLDPLLNKRVKANYQEHTNEDDDPTSSPPLPSSNSSELNSRANVLNRVGHQTNKWKRQVREQRRHIYDRRTMLN